MPVPIFRNDPPERPKPCIRRTCKVFGSPACPITYRPTAASPVLIMMFNILHAPYPRPLGPRSPSCTRTPPRLPSTSYTCPSQDSAGFSVGTTNYATEPIFCSYPAYAGENANDFYCTYSSVCFLRLSQPVACSKFYAFLDYRRIGH